MSEKMREEFEVWCESIGYHTTRDCDTYSGGYPRAMWMAWQASRAALVVELPSQSDLSAITFLDYPIMDAGEIKASLDSAGVSYK